MSTATYPSVIDVQPSLSAEQTAPVPKKRWVTVPLRRDKQLLSRSRLRTSRTPTVASFYGDLDQWPDAMSDAVVHQ